MLSWSVACFSAVHYLICQAFGQPNTSYMYAASALVLGTSCGRGKSTAHVAKARQRNSSS